MAPGIARSRLGSSRCVPERYSGCVLIAVCDRGSPRPSVEPADPRCGERARQPGQRGGQQRRAAPVDGDVVDGLPGQSRERRGDRVLERVVRLEVGLRGPAVGDTGGEHRRVLAGAVHQDRRLRLPAPDQLLADLVVERPARWRLECVLGESGGGEDAAYPLDVEGLAGVRRARQREQLTLEREARLAACASAWIGLLHDRGSIGPSTSPAAASTEPSRSSTTHDP